VDIECARRAGPGTRQEMARPSIVAGIRDVLAMASATQRREIQAGWIESTTVIWRKVATPPVASPRVTRTIGPPRCR
jgi:hypothetical protein